ncbi:hypothetical protein VE04_04371 [Pseudogymnoascus sp. 24MN13]|nr:hypothetical protein VE04_04371 [Pseudogymnoascus sp. 24MN13]
MAEDDAEIALLHQMQSGQESVSWGQGADDTEEDVGATNTENSDQPVKEEEKDFSDDQVLRALSPSDALSDGEEYNPESANPVPSHTTTSLAGTGPPSRASPARKPKTIGGFLADDSDDEDDVEIATSKSTALLQPPTSGPTRSVSRSPLHLEAVPQDSAAQTPVPTLETPNPLGDGERTSAGASNQTSTPNASATVTAPIAGTSLPKARLPHDRVGILEDRIKEDPRGDLDAWLSLITEHRNRNKLDDARVVYDRFFKVFPMAADIWVAYAEMELGIDNFFAAEQIFGKSLLTVPHVQLWSVYLNYIRRRNDLTNDVTGSARATISQAYDFVLANVGIDRDSGKIWQEYIQFIRSAPGQIGGSSWQDQQKMDQMRKAYQRAVCVPMSNVNALWKEYDQFEMSLNKITGRKFLQEKSPSYMTARSANTAMENITRGLVRTNLPRLPPALGFEGDKEYLEQVGFWRQWINWEQEDPLVFRDEDIQAYKQRVIYVYKHAVMALRFWPEMWVEAAEWSFNNGMEKEGNDFLSQGIAANPESCLLAFKQADRLETVLPMEEGEEGLVSRGAAVRAPYNTLLDALYDLIKKLKTRENAELARIQEFAMLDSSINPALDRGDDDEDDTDRLLKEAKESARDNQLKVVKQGYHMQSELTQRTLSFAWIALMRAMRRVQGKGKVGAPVGGSRQILSDARVKGKITSDVYIASALIEHNVYKDPAGTKIFEKGAKLFPEDELFILEYLKHLLSIGDTTNARAVFETSVNRLTQKPENVAKAKPLYVFFHKYESEYGELSQINRLEQRMADLFPEDQRLARFSSRYSSERFDPTVVRLIISPVAQMRPKSIMQSIEEPISVQPSPRPQYREISPRPQPRQEVNPIPAYLQPTNSPKRPLGGEESDNESGRPRKLIRGESPLKGAAGRRLDQQKRMQQTHGGVQQWQSNGPAQFMIPRDITFLLSIIPRAETYNATLFNAEAMVRLLDKTPIPDYSTWKASRDQAPRYY